MADQTDIVTKIINCVKQYPALYDTAHEDYNRYHKKIQIWNNIAAEVNYSDGKVAQTKWRNIRDSYVKHLKSLQTQEPAYKKYRNWQWVEQMSFLQKFLGGNKHRPAVKIEDNPETSLIEVVESVYGEPSNYTEIESYNTSSNQKMKTESPSSPWYGNLNGAAGGGGNDIMESVADCDYSYRKDYILEHNGIDPNIDATDLLFLSYAKMLKSLSKKRQIRVKMKISEIIGEAELEEENEKTAESNHVDSSECNEYFSKKMKYDTINNARFNSSENNECQAKKMKYGNMNIHCEPVENEYQFRKAGSENGNTRLNLLEDTECKVKR